MITTTEPGGQVNEASLRQLFDYFDFGVTLPVTPPPPELRVES
jgi:hypothetical protein